MRRSSQLLLAFAAGSLLLHWAVLAVLPQFKREPPPAPARSLNVALVSVEPPQPLPATSPEPKSVAPPAVRERLTSVPKREPAPRLQPQPQAVPLMREERETSESALRVAPAPGGRSETGTVAKPPAATGGPQAEPVLQATPPGFHASYLRNPAPSYPLIARRNGEQGTVMLRVLVTREGIPAQVSVEKSSGSHHLDSAALEAVKTWRFVPARRGAEAVEAWVLVPVVFRLESAS